ncbi:MAG: HEAT repeat domain-containing protein [Chitinophagaceae bacterium]
MNLYAAPLHIKMASIPGRWGEDLLIALPRHSAQKILIILIFLFLLANLVILIFIFSFQAYRRVIIKQTEKLHRKYEHIIGMAIFHEEESADGLSIDIPIPVNFQNQMLIKFNRQVMIDLLILAKKNFSGVASQNLKQLFLQLSLQQDALIKLKNHRWYIKAKGIQELSIMDLSDFQEDIFPFTSHPNDLVRMEAQSALINFSGFEGLKFLNNLSYPLNDWQQMALLKLISKLPPESFMGIAPWLDSPNDTVVIFALKLIQYNHRYELHHQVADCLQHKNPLIRELAVSALAEIYQEGTAALVISRFNLESASFQLTVIKALPQIGTSDQVSFLMDQLANENNEIKLAAARCILQLDPDGMDKLESSQHANEYPLQEIILQIKGEKAA